MCARQSAGRSRSWRRPGKSIHPALSLLAVNLITPKYKSEARLLIEGRENIFLRPEAERQNPEVRDRVDVEALTSQAQILQSRDVALAVIRELKLYQRPEFDPALRGVSVTSVFLSMLGLGKDALRLAPEERVLTNFYERLSVLPVDKSPGGIGETLEVGAGKSRLELWWWIVACAALPMLLIEWWVYTRRVHL